MKTDNTTLIDGLLEISSHNTAAAEKFLELTHDQLLFKREGEWCILECLEHLNLYGDFYLPEIEKRMMTGSRNKPGKLFKSGWIGNYFAELMQVKDGKMKKMQSPRDKNPRHNNTKLPITVVNRFLKQQETLVNLLNKCRHLDLVDTKCAISLTPLIKLRLGDTLRFYVYHIERHILQAERVLQVQSVENLTSSKLSVQQV